MVKGKAGQPVREPHFGADVHYLERKPAVNSTGLILKHYDDMNYGYLRIAVDKQKLQIGFHLVNAGQSAQSRIDMGDGGSGKPHRYGQLAGKAHAVRSVSHV